MFKSAAERAEADTLVCASVLDSQGKLPELRPKCMFVNGAGPKLARTTAWMREHPLLFCTPVIAMVSDLRDNSFVQAYRNGADDVVLRSNMGGVTRRIANLHEFDPSARPPATRGSALISHQNHEQRRRLGRVLRQASFDVHFAVDADEIMVAMASETSPDLVVVSDELLPVSEIARARHVADAPKTPFVVVASTASTRIMLDSGLERVATISENAPHDHLLFLANDLMRDGWRRARNSPRYLFDTICSFRAEGVFTPEHGLTYNLSETGIYVRTLDPPSKNTALWLEMRPPGTTAAVHLRGTPVWVTTPGRGVGATPPGFGLRIDADRSPARDLEVYRQAYFTLGEVPDRLALSWIP